MGFLRFFELGAVLHADPGVPLTLGADVTVGHQAMLHGCTIGEGTLVGIQAVVLNGAVIGRECLIGACTLIPEGKVIPDRSLVIGTPGKVVRDAHRRRRWPIIARPPPTTWKMPAVICRDCANPFSGFGCIQPLSVPIGPLPEMSDASLFTAVGHSGLRRAGRAARVDGAVRRFDAAVARDAARAARAPNAGTVTARRDRRPRRGRPGAGRIAQRAGRNARDESRRRSRSP